MGLYIIVEGKEYCSEYTFWETIRNEFMSKSKKIDIVGCGGFSNLVRYINEHKNTYTRNDTIIISFDNIESIEVANFIDNQLSRLNKQINKLYITLYYCFEELFLSYYHFENYLSTDYNDIISNINNINLNAIPDKFSKSDKYSAFTFIRDCINKGIDYREDSINHNKYIRHLVKKSDNRERLSARVLSEMTEKGKHIKINKGHLGACWIKDCNTLRQSKKWYNCLNCNFCKAEKCNNNKGVTKCCNCNKNSMTAKEKILDLQNNSIFGKMLKIEDLKEFL